MSDVPARVPADSSTHAAEVPGEPAIATPAEDPLAEMNFTAADLEPRKVVVNIVGKKHFLVEATADAAAKYRNATTRAAKMDSVGNITGMDGLADAEPIALAACLYRANADGNLPLDKNGNLDASYRYSETHVRSFTDSVVTKLFDRLKAISPTLVPTPAKKGGKEDDGPKK